MHLSFSILLFGNVVISLSQKQHPLLPTSLGPISETMGIESCQFLSQQLPRLVTFPIDHEYKDQESQYWSLNQARQRPTCRVAPGTVNEVATVINVLRDTNSPFAVKGGGHSSVVNASNVDGGVTIDLFKLSSIIVAPNKTSVSVSSGAKWREVYHQLDAQNLGVSGARAGSVGVSGYLLGGGLSLFSGTRGWACDAIQGFEIVLANASIIEATATKHEDLFHALKGGGSSFGIVTRFRLDVFPLTSFHAGFITYAWSSLSQVMQAIQSFNENAHHDPMSSTTLSFAYDPALSSQTLTIALSRIGETQDSPILTPFFQIPHIFASLQRMKLSQLAQLLDDNNPSGFRQYKSTFTVKNDASLATYIVQTFVSRCRERFGPPSGPGFRVGYLLQPLTAEHLSAGKVRGGNPMGLHGSEPLLLISIEARWSVQNDTLGQNTIDDLIRTFELEAARRDLHHTFKYLNYASAQQDVFASYGQGEVDMLRRVRDRYDGTHFFGDRLALPFKL